MSAQVIKHSNEKQARAVCETLGEPEGGQAQVQIQRMILSCGMKFIKERLKDTQSAEQNGGLMTDDGLRKRSAGGTFFKLCKNRMSKEERRSVFGARKRRSEGAG